MSQVADKYGEASLEARLMKAIALVVTPFRLRRRTSPSSFIRTSPRRASAATLLPRSSELVRDDRLRQSDDGYRLQSPEQKDWEKTRRGIDPAGRRDSPPRALKERLAGLSVTAGRAFKVEVRRGREGGRGRHSAPYR